MKISTAFPSKYLKASDLNEREIPLVIARVELEKIGRDDDHKPVVYFTKAKKGLVLNKTNAKVITTAYGDDTDAWEDKEIILFAMMVQFGDEMVDSIRVKLPKAVKAPAAHVAAQAAAQAENPGADMDDEIPF